MFSLFPRFLRHGLLACLLLQPLGAAWAWNAAGHRLIAAMAWRQMNVSARQTATALLQQHPDYRKWLPRSQQDMPYAAYHVFVESSTWPDEIRHDPRFSDHPGNNTLPGFPDLGRHGDWHYLNLPLEAPGQAAQGGELDSRLEILIRQLGDRGYRQRSYALPWVIHLLGDLHQPLHVASRNRDEGGNRQTVIDPRSHNHHARPENLHAFWDQLPGRSNLRGTRLEAEVERLLNRYRGNGVSGGIAGWRDESYRLARELAYPPAGAQGIPVIDERWRQRAEEAAGRRLVDAAYRLADVLNRNLAR